jgi:hypothetical protein
MRLAMFFYCGKEPNVLSIAMASAARPFAIALIALFTIVLEPPFAQLVQQGDTYTYDPETTGKGIGKAMCESLQEARSVGCTAMQFTMVVSTNESAVALWQKLRLLNCSDSAQAFRHKEFGRR